MLFTMFRTLSSALQSQHTLAMENLALRHQLLILQRTVRASTTHGPGLLGRDGPDATR